MFFKGPAKMHMVATVVISMVYWWWALPLHIFADEREPISSKHFVRCRGNDGYHRHVLPGLVWVDGMRTVGCVDERLMSWQIIAIASAENDQHCELKHCKLPWWGPLLWTIVNPTLWHIQNVPRDPTSHQVTWTPAKPTTIHLTKGSWCLEDGLTGSAWGDWAAYTDSPLRAFENELGVQAGALWNACYTAWFFLYLFCVSSRRWYKIVLKSKRHVKMLLQSNTQAWIMNWICRLLLDFGTPPASQLTGASRTSSDAVKQNWSMDESPCWLPWVTSRLSHSEKSIETICMLLCQTWVTRHLKRLQGANAKSTAWCSM